MGWSSSNTGQSSHCERSYRLPRYSSWTRSSTFQRGANTAGSASTDNPNVTIIFLVYKYHPADNTYTIDGKSGLQAARELLSNVTKFIRTEDNGNIKLSELPEDYNPSMKISVL